jgi:hypothetical protein
LFQLQPGEKIHHHTNISPNKGVEFMKEENLNGDKLTVVVLAPPNGNGNGSGKDKEPRVKVEVLYPLEPTSVRKAVLAKAIGGAVKQRLDRRK